MENSGNRPRPCDTASRDGGLAYSAGWVARVHAAHCARPPMRPTGMGFSASMHFSNYRARNGPRACGYFLANGRSPQSMRFCADFPRSFPQKMWIAVRWIDRRLSSIRRNTPKRYSALRWLMKIGDDGGIRLKNEDFLVPTIQCGEERSVSAMSWRVWQWAGLFIGRIAPFGFDKAQQPKLSTGLRC